MDDDPDGLLTYRRLNPRGIENQTWRDSWDSLSHADGGMPDRDRPVAALDVQVLARRPGRCGPAPARPLR